LNDRDNIYISDKVKHISFAFDEEVTRVFPDMISRSVPGYKSSLNIITDYARRYIQSDSIIYDLGCSLGAATDCLLPFAGETNKIIAIDNSISMINLCKDRFNKSINSGQVIFFNKDIRRLEFKTTSFVVINYLLQFLEIKERHSLLTNIFSSLVSGGVCILSEKVHFESSSKTSYISDIHHKFKSINGYTDLEIARKRDALEGVLFTETEGQHLNRLKKIGFSRVNIVMSNLNFITMACIK